MSLEFELVLPCYNEGKSLPRLLNEVIRAAKEFGYSSNTFQLVLVQNGSTDDTAQVARELQGISGAWFRIVDLPVNRGYGTGLWAGLQSTTAPIIGWSHADLQCSPRDAFFALEKLKISPVKRVIRGRRIQRNWGDQVVSRIFALLSRILLGAPRFEINAQPKVFPRELLKDIIEPPPHFAFDLYVLYRAARAGYREEFITVNFPPRIHGVSKWAATFLGRSRTFLNMIRYIWNLFLKEGRVG